MPDKTELARRVFAQFAEEYERRSDPNVTWWLTFAEDDGIPGLTLTEVNSGLSVLHQKGLVQHMGMDGWRLTDDGREACLHPDVLECLLGPRRQKWGVTTGSRRRAATDFRWWWLLMPRPLAAALLLSLAALLAIGPTSAPPDLEHRGCCSHHGGVCGCKNDRAVCCGGERPALADVAGVTEAP